MNSRELEGSAVILAVSRWLWTSLRTAPATCGQAISALALVAGIVLGGCGGDDSEASERHHQVRRIITLTPSATEVVAALGATDRLVGVDRYSTYPPAVKNLPEVGDFLHPSFDAILRLEPDLVIADAVQAKVADGLNAAGIRTLVLPMRDLDDVRAAITAVGAAIDQDAASRELVAAIDAAIANARSRASARADTPRFLAVVDRERGGLAGLVACGPESYLAELLAIVGADNALAITSPHARISPEAILHARPGIIIDVTHGADEAGARAAYAVLPEVPAVKTHRIYVLAEPYYIAPGPRVIDAIAGLERVVYGSSD